MPMFWNVRKGRHQRAQDNAGGNLDVRKAGQGGGNSSDLPTYEEGSHNLQLKSTVGGNEGDDMSCSEDSLSVNSSQEEGSGDVSDDSDEFDEAAVHKHSLKKGAELSGPSIHEILAKGLMDLMKTCGLTSYNHDKMASLMDEESRRTFSLIVNPNEVNVVADGLGVESRSIINESQLNLINRLTEQLKAILDTDSRTKQRFELLSKNETLFSRYGAFKGVIGRGAYGVIKIVESNKPADCFEGSRRSLYATKILHRKGKHETKEALIERILSEFIISISLRHKNIVRTVDLLVTLPHLEFTNVHDVSFNLAMMCCNGPSLFTYMSKKSDTKGNYIDYMTLNEIDCFIKQIGKGIQYMHKHGVAHCDLKLENILIDYEEISDLDGTKSSAVLKLCDFGKSNVFRTKWDADESPCELGPVGSTPYMSPEEFLKSSNGYIPYSMSRKDCWSLGILITVLFNIRRYYYSGLGKDVYSQLDSVVYNDNDFIFPWRTTEPKSKHLVKKITYKDNAFDTYTKTRMISKYLSKSKEWVIERPGEFKPIEEFFRRISKSDIISKYLGDCENDDQGDNAIKEKNRSQYQIGSPTQGLDETKALKNASHCESNTITPKFDFEENDDLNDLRKMITYKLLDTNPQSRMTVDQFMKSDWMASVDICS